MNRHSPYLFQVVPLFLQCQGNLKMTISRIHFSPGRYESLYRLQRSLAATEVLLCDYVFQIVREHQEGGTSTSEKTTRYPLLPETTTTNHHGDMLRALEYLKHISNSESGIADTELSSSCRWRPTIQSQSAESQLLFRLIVIFQLLLVRIDDAHYVITGHRIEDKPSCNDSHEVLVSNYNSIKSIIAPSLGIVSLGIAGRLAGILGPKQIGNATTRFLSVETSSNCSKRQLISTAAKLGSSLLAFVVFKNFLTICWMTDKIIRSNSEILEWNHQWELIHRIVETSSINDGDHHSSTLPSVRHNTGLSFPNKAIDDSSLIDIDEKSRTLIEYARKHGRKSYFWRSTGEIRFLMVKRFMDIYYASVGVGVHCTKDNPNNSFFLPLVAGAAASFYTITGAPTTTVVNDTSSRDLIQHAWGMVSLPVLKDLMLQASRLVKGASVADRIVLCGVPCFILSKDPAPELAAVLQRQAKVRSGDSSPILSQLSTIAEETETEGETNTVSQPKSFVGSKGQYRQRDVILHLTGGGFFAHTIASDLPYLLDWSSCTGSVVICPEYSLLPENQFPTQLNQVAEIYASLASGNTGVELGFDVSSIIVTGESAGGNLAAALCVKLALKNLGNECGNDGNIRECSQVSTSAAIDADNVSIELSTTKMPDAIMLSCPALNLTTELSHSRVVGTEDPVLPKALISAISEAYLPTRFDIKHPLVSPFYAADRVLRYFPPTLLFASSKDPLLDDSVTFNERLRVLGVDSELIAVHNVPHAYLGLGTAGFPEAVQVQQYAMDWLSSKFSNSVEASSL